MDRIHYKKIFNCSVSKVYDNYVTLAIFTIILLLEDDIIKRGEPSFMTQSFTIAHDVQSTLQILVFSSIQRFT